MNQRQRLKDYLRKCTPAQVDETALDKLRREMEEAVPEIAKSIQEREELAAELRIVAAKPRRPATDGDD